MRKIVSLKDKTILMQSIKGTKHDTVTQNELVDSFKEERHISIH